jgi:Bax protein
LHQRYRTYDLEELLARMQTHPVSIILAQAALESAWGTSRFYTEGNNVFGIWSFSASDKRMASHGVRNGEPVYLKKYRTLSDAVEDYFLVLARGPFEDFRIRRLKTNNPYVLINFLRNYSEKEEEYTAMLKSIIRNNNLTRFDDYQLDPKFIRYE